MINTKIIAFSDNGARIANELVVSLPTNYLASGYYKEAYLNLKQNKLSLAEFSKQAFEDTRLIIYIGALGIATRAIAPYIKSKDVDPAVLCIDDQANYVIPLLSGHLGNANNFAYEISQILNAQAIITTATDLNNIFAVDNFALKNDLLINDLTKIKVISSALLANKKIGFISDYEISEQLPSFIDVTNQKIGIYLGERDYQPFKQTIKLQHKKYVVGIGVRKNKDSVELADYFYETLSELGIDYRLVSTIVSIDLKKNEPALLDLVATNRYNFITYPSHELNEVSGEYTASEFVKKTTGVDNVCERSVAKYAGYENIIMKKKSKNGMTLAIGTTLFNCKF